MLAGQATAVVLDPESGTVLDPDTDTYGPGQPPGRLRRPSAAWASIMSPNQGQVWNQMLGGIGNPLIVDAQHRHERQPGRRTRPQRRRGAHRPGRARPRPAMPPRTPSTRAGSTPPSPPPPAPSTGSSSPRTSARTGPRSASPPCRPRPARCHVQPGHPHQRHQPARLSHDRVHQVPPGQLQHRHGRRSRPTPTSSTWAGPPTATRAALIRIDLTTSGMPTTSSPYSDVANDGGDLDLASTGPAPVDSNICLRDRHPGRLHRLHLSELSSAIPRTRSSAARPCASSTTPASPTMVPASSGSRSTAGGTDYHEMATMIDPTTGLPRLIFGNDQGVWTILDNNGTFETQIGDSDQLAGLDRNGNLQITQFYYGAAQPSSAAAQIAGALFYGSAQDDGGPVSAPTCSPAATSRGTAPAATPRGVATDQQGDGTVVPILVAMLRRRDTNFFQYIQPGNIFQVNGMSAATYGLLQASNGLTHARPAVAVHWASPTSPSTRSTARTSSSAPASAGSSPPPTGRHTGSTSATRRSSAAPARSATPWPTARPIPAHPRASATWATSSTSAPRPARST